MIRTSVTDSAAPRVPLFCSYRIFDAICDLLLNRRMATWNLFVNYLTPFSDEMFTMAIFKIEVVPLEFSDLVALKKKLPNTSFVPLFTSN